MSQNNSDKTVWAGGESLGMCQQQSSCYQYCRNTLIDVE